MIREIEWNLNGIDFADFKTSHCFLRSVNRNTDFLNQAELL